MSGATLPGRKLGPDLGAGGASSGFNAEGPSGP